MKHEKFLEYINRKGKVDKVAKIEKVASFNGKVDAAPVREKKSKEAGGHGQVSKPKKYKNGVDKDPNAGQLKNGLADKGDKSLKMNIADGNSGEFKKVAKTKMQEWIDKTKNMSLAEFTQNLRKDSIRGLEECDCQELPHNSIKETVNACKCNPKFISDLVREMKRNDLLEILTTEMIQHEKTLETLEKIMESNDFLNKRISEMVSPPIGLDATHPMRKPNPINNDEISDEPTEDDEMSDSEEGEDEFADDEASDDSEEDYSDNDGSDEGDGTDYSDDEEFDDSEAEMSPDNEDDSEIPPEIPKKNALSAMKNHPAFMKQY